MQLDSTKIATSFSEYFEHMVISMIKQKLHEYKQAVKQLEQRTVIPTISPEPTFPGGN